MYLEVYNKVKEIIGTLPVELEYVYAICTILLFCLILFAIISPFVFLYKLGR